MAIGLKLEKTSRPLFCESKWWGDPDMPADASYPVMKVAERPDGTSFIVRPDDNVEGMEVYDYPLTFICQIRLEDIAALDPDGLLPHDGMLYFFAAVDEYAGYASPVHLGAGEWPSGAVAVKYSRTVNMETFQACMMVDEEDKPLADPALAITFSSCPDDSDGIRMLGVPSSQESPAGHAEWHNLLQIACDETAGTMFNDGAALNFLVSESDLEKGILKRPHAVLG